MNDNPGALADTFYKYENQPVIRIITETGKTLVGTHNHPVLTNEGWTRLDCLNMGDKIKVVTRISSLKRGYLLTNYKTFGRARKIRLPKYLDEELAAIMGYLVGDGHIKKGKYEVNFYVNTEEKDLLPKLKKLFVKKFGVVPYIKKKSASPHMYDRRLFNSTKGVFAGSCTSRNLAENLYEVQEKRVPPKIMASKNKVAASFLKWLFEADGYVTTIRNGEKFRIGLASKSRDLLHDVLILLLRFGITARINKYDLVINRSDDIITYVTQIGFVSNKKMDKMKKAYAYAKKPKTKKIRKTKWERIKKIEALEPTTVYDITVPIKHKFIANGIINHNSGKSELGNDLVQISPIGVYCSKKVTGVGLYEAILSANNGILVIDDLDKIPKSDREQFLEAMSFGRITDHKYRVHRQLPARINVVGICNPLGNRLSEDMSVVSQAPFNAPLLSRFNLILPFYDVDLDLYPDIAERYEQVDHSKRQKALRKYLIELRQRVPVVTEKGSLRRKAGYYVRTLKEMGRGSDMITPRTLKGAINMMRARARMCGRDQATQKDFEYIKRIMDEIYW